MTSTSVKDFGGLMNYVNTNSVGANQSKSFSQSMNFGDVMTKAQDSQTPKDVGQTNTKTPKTEESDKNDFKSKLDSSRKADSSRNVDEKKPAKQEKEPKEVSEDEMNALEEASKEIVQAIANEMEVTVEEVEEVMKVMGLNLVSLLDSSNIGNLVLEISDETEPIALVTNENLFETVKELTTVVDATIADVAKDMDIEVSDFKNLVELAESQVNSPEMEMSVETNSDTDTIKEAPKFTVEVNDNSIEVDENGNEIKTTTVTPKDTKADQKESEEESKNDNDSGFRQTSENLMKTPTSNNLVNEIGEKATEIPQSPTSFVSEQTQDIMNQIMDRMKIDLKPEMDEIEIELHPASLGNVKVNLTSNKAGEVTAEFKVQNELVKAAVEAELNDLRETFKATGTKVTEIEVSVELQNFDSNLWQGKGHDSNAESRNSQERRPRRINLNDINALFEDEATEEEMLAAKIMEANGNTVDFTA